MFLCRIVFCFCHSTPEGAAVVYINISDIFSSELHYTSMGHARLVCTHLYIDTHLVEGRELQVPFFSNGLLYTVSFLLSLTTPFSIKKHWWISAIRFSPNLIHQGASVITEISSTHGYKNSASSSSDEVIHGPELIPQNSKKVKNYTK